MNKEREILQAIIEICDTGHWITFKTDWNVNLWDYSITVTSSNAKYTNRSFLGATYNQLINELHSALVEGRGLS